MQKYLVRGLSLCLTLIMAFGNVGKVNAQSNYNSYVYDEWDESVAAPASYSAILAKNGLEMGSGAFNKPQDFFMGADGCLYVADTGNNRIVVLDNELALIGVIETVRMNGEEIPLTGVQGLYVTDDHVIYACQPELARILVIQNGEVIDLVERPVSNLIGDDFVFAPLKVGVDVYGRVYVLSKGCYSGVLQYDLDKSFMGFYGANKVEVTADVLFDYMWKSILSDEQRAAMTSIIPIEYSNLDCCADGFVYTSTVGTQIPISQIKKLNPLGNNIYKKVGDREISFGDKEFTYTLGTMNQPSFIDVKVDEAGFIYAVDLTSCRIFQRDQEGHLIAVIGGTGNQLGTFKAPVAIEVYANRVYVLDRLKSNITVFEKTEYGKMVEEALQHYMSGEYAESIEKWKEVLVRNANSELAYIGLGKAYSQCGEYEESLEYLKYSGDRHSYSRAFGKNRLYIVKAYGAYAVMGVAVVAVAAVIISKIAKRRKKDEVK